MSTITSIYDKTPVGSTMLISASSEVIAGVAASLPHAHLERFAVLVADLESLERPSLTRRRTRNGARP